jgi:hypothetical protein
MHKYIWDSTNAKWSNAICYLSVSPIAGSFVVSSLSVKWSGDSWSRTWDICWVPKFPVMSCGSSIVGLKYTLYLVRTIMERCVFWFRKMASTISCNSQCEAIKLKFYILDERMFSSSLGSLKSDFGNDSNVPLPKDPSRPHQILRRGRRYSRVNQPPLLPH